MTDAVREMHAMLDEAMAMAAIAKVRLRYSFPTLDLRVVFLGRAQAGPLIGEGRVVEMGRTVAFLEGQLRNEEGTLLAEATATATVADPPRRPKPAA